MTTLSVRVEDTVVRELAKIEKKWSADRSEVIRRLLASAVQQWKLNNAVERLREGKMSIGKAAAEAGLSLWEMLDIVKQKNIDWTGYTPDDLEKDIAFLRKK